MLMNGWQLFAFKYFQDRLLQLEADVSHLAHNNPNTFVTHPKAKLLKSVLFEIGTDVPNNPDDPKFRQGKTLGDDYKHWRRVKKGLPQRYRLFFMFRANRSSIVYAWLNDDNTLRKKGSKTDVYNVFKRMLKKGEIPDSFDELVSKSNDIKAPLNTSH